jgi:hypothetical protein
VIEFSAKAVAEYSYLICFDQLNQPRLWRGKAGSVVLEDCPWLTIRRVCPLESSGVGYVWMYSSQRLTEILFLPDIRVPKYGNLSKPVNLRGMYGVYRCIVPRDSVRFPFRRGLLISKSWQLVKTCQLKGDVGCV